ncbi:MAG TPA: ABC transporter permease [Polyangiaceae bacterium]|nr:ABC transporter permease [Polyangiaceae bacterium]
MTAPELRPGLLALYGLALLGLWPVARRALGRLRAREPLRLSVSLMFLGQLGGALVATALAAGLALLLNRALPRLGGGSFFGLVAGAWLLVTGASVFVARRGRDRRVRLGLPGYVRALPWLSWSAAGLAFLALTSVALRLPVSRGTRYVLWHELVRFGALALGVYFLLGVLAALLPHLLDRLERFTFVPFVGARHVRASKSGFLTVISVLSICGVAVSSCALCSVVSIMGGFGQDLKRKILGNNAHITVDRPGRQGGIEGWEPMLEAVRRVPGVAAATPVVAGEAMASSNASTAGVLVRGIDPDGIGDVIDLVKNIEFGRLEYLVREEKLGRLPPDEPIGQGLEGQGYRRAPMRRDEGLEPLDPAVREALREGAAAAPLPGVIIGRELARTLHLLVGDEVTFISPLGDLGPMGVLPRSRKFRVAAIFYSGMYEYDTIHVYVRQDVAQKFFDLPGRVTHLDVRAVEAEGTGALLDPIREALAAAGAAAAPAGEPAPAGAAAKGAAEPLRVRDWREMNKNLFSALKLERIATFVILSVAIAVASFCIICTLLLMVTEKGKEIAILKAIGASDAAVRAVFMAEGVLIGSIGTTFGVATGVATCLGLKWFGVRLDPDVYYIDRLPVATNASDYALVAACALLICTLATVYPAGAASRLRPVDGLRYE